MNAVWRVFFFANSNQSQHYKELGGFLGIKNNLN